MLRADDFKGLWRLTRVIEDRLAGTQGEMHGTANFTDEGQGVLLYHETGKLRLGGGPVMEAARRYHWQFGQARVDVTFEDGRAFHSFCPEGHAAGTDHPCGEDYYTVRYDFTRWPNWRATWSVKGPRKDYTSVSEYIDGPSRT